MSEQVDVAVIGMGPGGENVAGKLAEAGLAVAGIDERLVGGECPYWGCVPSKMMIRAADALAEGRRIPLLAGTSTVDPSWQPVAARIRDEATDDWDDRVAVERFTGKGGRFLRGHGRILGPGRVGVGEVELAVRRAIVVNTGTTAAVPPVDGLAGTPFWTNHEAIETPELPASLAVLGGGAIGVELAQVFARFGCRVSVVEAAQRLLPLEEPESGELVARALSADGIDVRTSAGVRSVSYDGSFTLATASGELHADRLLVATGRRTDLPGLGVGSVGIDESARFIPVDERLRAAPGVWALGDVTGKGQFTHVSMYQSEIVVRDILGQPGPPADYRALPRVTFTDPEVGAVGLTEQGARDAGLPVAIAVSPLPESARGWIHKAGNDGFVKLVADTRRDVLVGATSAGPAGGEVLGLLAVAVHAEVPLERLRSMMYAYPTFHRAVEDALRRLAEAG